MAIETWHSLSGSTNSGWRSVQVLFKAWLDLAQMSRGYRNKLRTWSISICSSSKSRCLVRAA
jgi:hypothetical protein